MEKVAFGYRNRIDDTTLSGGSWQAPLTNIQTRRLAQKARSTDLLSSSTYIDVEFEEPKLIQVVSFHEHNFSVDARVRITAGSAPGLADIYDTGDYEVWPAIWGTLSMHWTDYHFWSGKIDPETRKEYPSNLIHIVTKAVKTRYWRFYFIDPTNEFGYVELGRIFMGTLLKPMHNVIYGASLGWQDNSQIDTSMLGVEYYNEIKKTRVAEVNFDFCDRREALEGMFELQRQSGNTREVLFIGNTEDVSQMVRLGFLGRLSKMDAIKWSFLDLHSTGFEVKEIL